ncbi:unnamed protein product [Dovyalis caffra]|uniref:Uncharacterized protein n=1 Tax=Dovyalis caffra TaxID=77055 RepID=A0AAV1RB46_9ROSI|nr:unnamed protein product [Dovyalis caffra]
MPYEKDGPGTPLVATCNKALAKKRFLSAASYSTFSLFICEERGRERKMEESFPMTGGDGPYSYTKNSSHQKKAAASGKTMLASGILENLVIEHSSRSKSPILTRGGDFNFLRARRLCASGDKMEGGGPTTLLGLHHLTNE